MDIICARHGNTFGPGDRVVWVGANEDLPLTAEGENQAQRLAAALKSSGVTLTAIFHGDLRRTRRYAEIIVENLGRESMLRRNNALTEIDYGDWANRTNEEIESKLGQAEALRLWNEKNIWPQEAHWGGSEESLRRAVTQFLEMLRDRYASGETVLVVTSNGILRFLASAALGPQAARDARFPFKMKTGNIGKITERNGSFGLAYWDVVPGNAPV